jgi:flavin-dependent dehydrogenase
MKNSYDCVIIGGGPAGSTAATLLADYGHSVLVLERSKFPRHHIGESLMPNTYWTFKRLGLLDKMKCSDFVVKESVQFVTASGRESAPFFFPDRDPGEWSYTWQVERSKFDEMLLNNARDHGAEAIEQATVREVRFEGERAVGVRADIGGETHDIRAKIVIDASGQAWLISRKLNLRYGDTKLKNAVIYSYYKGALRDPGRNSGATLVSPRPGRGWFWFIPLSNDITSVGVVACRVISTTVKTVPRVLEDEFLARRARRRPAGNAICVGQTRRRFSYRSGSSGAGWIPISDARISRPALFVGRHARGKGAEYIGRRACALVAGDTSAAASGGRRATGREDSASGNSSILLRLASAGPLHPRVPQFKDQITHPHRRRFQGRFGR